VMMDHPVALSHDEIRISDALIEKMQADLETSGVVVSETWVESVMREEDGEGDLTPLGGNSKISLICSRLGERLGRIILEDMFPLKGEGQREITWLNEREESYRPMDYEIKVDGGVKYCEVKTKTVPQGTVLSKGVRQWMISPLEVDAGEYRRVLFHFLFIFTKSMSLFECYLCIIQR
jgi:hypothetical protein